MDLLADENQHPIVVQRLRGAGHRVEWIVESAPGLTDENILRRPDIGALVLLTYDRDFGDLIFHRGYPAPLAIVYTRLGRADPASVAERVAAALEAGIPSGHIVTITKDGFRSKPFPAGAQDG